MFSNNCESQNTPVTEVKAIRYQMIIKDTTLFDVDYHKFTDSDCYHNSCLSYMTIYYILGNGTIEIDEFVDMMKDKVLNNGDNEDLIVQETFNVFDIDKTGMVTCENLHQVFASLGIKCSEDEIKQMIEGADLKKDGGVDLEGNISIR